MQIKRIFCLLLVFVALVGVIAAPKQNVTHATAAPKQNKNRVLANPKQNKTKITSQQHVQHVQNNKKTNIPTSTDEFMDSIIGLALDVIGKISEVQEMLAELF